MFLLNVFILYFCLSILAENDDDGFDLIEPSLIQHLKKILDQYPDDGQILKVRKFLQKKFFGLQINPLII